MSTDRLIFSTDPWKTADLVRTWSVDQKNNTRNATWANTCTKVLKRRRLMTRRYSYYCCLHSTATFRNHRCIATTVVKCIATSIVSNQQPFVVNSYVQLSAFSLVNSCVLMSVISLVKRYVLRSVFSLVNSYASSCCQCFKSWTTTFFALKCFKDFALIK